MHKDSLKTFLRVQRAFSGNPKAAFMVLNNTGHETEAFPADIAYLKGVNYKQEDVLKAIKEGLDDAYRQRKISTKRHAGMRRVSRVSAKRIPSRSAVETRGAILRRDDSEPEAECC